MATAIGAEGGAEMTEIGMTAGPTGTTAREVLKRTGIGAEVVTTVPDAARTSGSEVVIRAWACAAIRTSPCEHASTPQRRCWIRRVLWRLSEQARRPRQVPARDRPPDKRCGEPPLQTPTQPHASRGGAQPESGFVIRPIILKVRIRSGQTGFGVGPVLRSDRCRVGRAP